MAAKRGSRRPRLQPRRGRPSIHVEAWSKVSVVLMDRQIACLDGLVGDIHKANGSVMTRAGIIRALVDGVMDSGIDVTHITSELEMRQRIAFHLKKSDR